MRNTQDSPGPILPQLRDDLVEYSGFFKMTESDTDRSAAAVAGTVDGDDRDTQPGCVIEQGMSGDVKRLDVYSAMHRDDQRDVLCDRRPFGRALLPVIDIPARPRPVDEWVNSIALVGLSIPVSNFIGITCYGRLSSASRTYPRLSNLKRRRAERLCPGERRRHTTRQAGQAGR